MAQSATDTPTADPEPIALEATAELDYSSDPDRPLTVEVELPGDVVDAPEVDVAVLAEPMKAVVEPHQPPTVVGVLLAVEDATLLERCEVTEHLLSGEVDFDQVEEILFFEIASSSKSRSAAILSTFLWLVVDVVGGGAQSFFLRVMVYRVSTPSPVRVCIPPPSTSTT